MSVNYNGTTINIILKEYSYEKKEIIIIITLFFIISFFIFKIADYSKKNITLDQIKENITNAQKIYVCRDYTDIKRVCRSNKLIKVIDDKETVKKIVELTNSFEEHNGAILLAEEVLVYLLTFLLILIIRFIL